jgi:adenylate cyclase
MSERTQRRLAAIVSTDVVGYSRLMGRDEAGTLERLNAHRSQLIDALIEKFGGRIVKTTGDGLLLEFPSVVAAVECAIATQEGMAERNGDAADDDAIRLRTGVHLGDVIVEGADIFGDGVNIAARLQEIGEADGVVISGNAHDSVEGRIEAIFVDGGDQQLKNITRPLRVWRWSPKSVAMPAMEAADAQLPLPDKPSVAVLPFDNMSGDPEQEYFADGIAEDLITALSRFRQFHVVARNSSFTYKGKAVDVKKIGVELGVRYVLEGSVRKAADRVRVTAQLIEASTGNHLWAERYDRELDDIFELQDEITGTITATIQPELEYAERLRSRSKPTKSLDAWDRYHLGYSHMVLMTREDASAAEEHYLAALEIDPSFSSAHAALAEVLRMNIFYGWTDAPDETRDRALDAARRAVAADPNDAFAHYALGRIVTLIGDVETAIRELRHALDLNPNFAWAEMGLGYVLNRSGKAKDALPHLYRSLRLNPRDPTRWGVQAMIGVAHYSLGAFESALEWDLKAVQNPASNFMPQLNVAACQIRLGRSSDARQSMAKVLSVEPDLTIRKLKVSMLYGSPEDPQSYFDILRSAGLPE